jgi:hypothetical protein
VVDGEWEEIAAAGSSLSDIAREELPNRRDSLGLKLQLAYIS